MLKYLTRTAIFTFLNALSLLTAVDSFIRLDLYLKNDELFVEKLSGFAAFVTGDSSLLNYHKLPEVSEQLSLCSIKLYIGIIIPRLLALSTCSSFMWVIPFVNGAQF